MNRSTIILRIDDPFGIRQVSLPGSPPSLHIEAQIVVRQWQAEKRKETEREQCATGRR